MKLLKICIFSFFGLFILINSLIADSIDDALKSDFSKQETVKIRFEVNKRLFSFEAGKFKIENIRKNRDRIRSITDRIIPWAIMEGLEPSEVARIIVYMYYAEESGAPFIDAEDLIPIVAKHEIPLKDFVYMVQYNRETKEASIPEDIKDAFLGYAFSKGWDGVSILTGGRGLILAKASGLDINKAASLILKRLPAKGAERESGELISITAEIIGDSDHAKISREIMDNIKISQKSALQSENSLQGLRDMIKESSEIDDNIKIIGKMNIPQKSGNNMMIDQESGMLPDIDHTQPMNKNWKILNRNIFFEAIRPWIGIPYKYGNKTGKPGIDCSGFTLNVLTDKRIGVPYDAIGRSSSSQSRAGVQVARQNLRAGDLVFFSASPSKNKITHVGLVTSSGYFVHASCSKGVINDSLNKKWWKQRYVTSRRIFFEVVK
jgi:hypothetical protein